MTTPLAAIIANVFLFAQTHRNKVSVAIKTGDNHSTIDRLQQKYSNKCYEKNVSNDVQSLPVKGTRQLKKSI